MASMQRETVIDVAPGIELGGHLTIPTTSGPRGVVAFPHVSRRSRRSAYNSVAAEKLCDAGFATLVFDGLTSDEKGSALAPDSSEIARRLAAATTYLSGEHETAELAVGYLATSAGAEGALLAAAALELQVRAVVIVGARPDALDVDLEHVAAPVLLIVDGTAVQLECGHRICDRLTCPSELVMIPGSNRLTEGDPRPFRRALRVATGWFGTHLAPTSSPATLTRR